MEMFFQLVTALAAIIGAVFAVKTFYAQKRSLFPVPTRNDDEFFVLSNPAPFAVTLREIRALRGVLAEQRGWNPDRSPNFYPIGEKFWANRILPAHSVTNVGFTVLIDGKRYVCNAVVRRHAEQEFDLLFTPLEEQKLKDMDNEQEYIGFAKGRVETHVHRFPR